MKVSGEWRIVPENQCVKEELKSYEAISYEVQGLRPDTQYRMEVRAHNVLGFSQPAQLHVQTALGEYNEESNEVPHRAGFYHVYTDSSTLFPSAASEITSCILAVLSSFVLCLFM